MYQVTHKTFGIFQGFLNFASYWYPTSMEPEYLILEFKTERDAMAIIKSLIESNPQFPDAYNFDTLDVEPFDVNLYTQLLRYGMKPQSNFIH